MVKKLRELSKKLAPVFLNDGFEALDEETLIYIMNQAETELFKRRWGLAPGTFSPNARAQCFAIEGRSTIIVKNILTVGQYAITVCDPEQTSMKLDLHKIAPNPSSKTRQIRILFTRKDWRRINGI